MQLQEVAGNEFPTPDTVDVLAEVCEYRAGKDIGKSVQTMRNLATTALVMEPGTRLHRQALKELAAHAIARIELLDKGEI